MDKTNDVIFKNTSKMDAEEVSIFQNAVLKKTIFTMSIIFFLIFVGSGIGLSFVDLTIGIILIACGLIGGFVLLPYLMKESQKKQNKQILGDKKYLNTYEFFEEYIAISTQTAPNNSNEYTQSSTYNLNYVDIYKVVVYKERLFIFINPSQSFIFNFKGMVKGTAGEVIELFKSKNLKIVEKSN